MVRPALVVLAMLPVTAMAHADGMRRLDPDGLPPTAGYSHVVVAPAGRLVTISGQVALDAQGKVVGAGDFEAQCTQVFENLKRALASVGLTFSDVVRTDMFVTDVRHLAQLRAVRARYLPADASPASTLVQVEALFRPELMVEVSVEAILPERPVVPPGGPAVAPEAR